MPSASDFATGRPEKEEHGTNDNKNDSKAPKDWNAQEIPDQEKYHSHDDHCSSTSIAQFTDVIVDDYSHAKSMTRTARADESLYDVHTCARVAAPIHQFCVAVSVRVDNQTLNFERRDCVRRIPS
jgi:hypothetical protein